MAGVDMIRISCTLTVYLPTVSEKCGAMNSLYGIQEYGTLYKRKIKEGERESEAERETGDGF